MEIRKQDNSSIKSLSIIAGVVVFLGINPLVFWWLLGLAGEHFSLATAYALEGLVVWIIINIYVAIAVLFSKDEPVQEVPRHMQ